MKVIVVEDQFLLREGLVRLLGAHAIEVVAALPSVQGIDACFETQVPDLLIMDIRLPPTHTDEGLIEAIRLRTRLPTLPVLLLSQNVELLYLRELLRTGDEGVGYLLKDRVLDDEQFVAALRTVASNGTVIDPTVIDALMRRRGDESLLSRLTPRELEVLTLMAEGDGNSRIAERLFVTEKAVAKHINSLLAKLDLPPGGDAARRVSAVLTFLRADVHA